MPAIWEKQWAHAKTKAKGGEGEEDAPAIVVGEFGGRFPEGSLEMCWAVAFASYLRETGLSDCFFWCTNPNSGDTGGEIVFFLLFSGFCFSSRARALFLLFSFLSLSLSLL